MAGADAGPVFAGRHVAQAEFGAMVLLGLLSVSTGLSAIALRPPVVRANMGAKPG